MLIDLLLLNWVVSAPGGAVVGLSYVDAVVLMGGRKNRTVAALDRLTGGLLLAASATGGGFALSLLGAKGELAQLSDELVRGLGQRLRGLDRFTRSERLAAAHSVLVLSAYFEVLADSDLPFEARELELTKAEQAALVGGGPPTSGRLGALAAGLLRAEVPMPAPQRPYETTLQAMRGFYQGLSAELVRFVSGLAVWDRLDDTRRDAFAATLTGHLPVRAVRRYEERFREFAAEFPEVAFWASLVDQQATREEVRRLGTGMAGLERILVGIAAGRVPDDRRMGLSRAYRAVLQRPVLATGDVPQGLCFPLLGDAYVNPDFRVAADPAERFAEESWWDEQPIRDDLEGFLLGYLTAPQAVEAPLLVLGQPGSGKSVLTQVLAARLPPGGFLVVRVVLRDAAADADLQSQIEDAVRVAIGESLTWPDLVRSATGALPVVLIDGFDELLQATGVSQTDYLRKVGDFQAREAVQGRPVTVVVTSRTAVADRAQLAPGTVVVRLEPFRESQISQWLGVWNDANTAGFAARGIRPLAPQTALEHAELASQPLLLLMLALYDADGNQLQRADAVLKKGELYERLLVGFAQREVQKTGADLSPRQFQEAVERELLRLSVVSFAMFSRSRQWVTEAELDADLPTLLGTSGNQAVGWAGLRAPISAAQVVVGRFFFVHETQATRDNVRLHTYEFLHATFGEYLIARLVVRELSDLADAAELATGRSRPEPPDDAFLHALLSYMPLTMRGTIMSFLAEQLQSLPELRRHQLATVLLGLFGGALEPRHDTRYSDYTPLALPVPARYAAYSANLVVLAILTIGEVAGTHLFPAPGAPDPVEQWRRIATLWRSQLPSEGWRGLIRAIGIDRTWDNDQRAIVLRPRDKASQRSRTDPHWSYRYALSDERRQSTFGWAHVDDKWLRDQTWFLCDNGEDSLAHALEPFASDFDSAISGFHSCWPEDGRAVSAANALITLWLTSGRDNSMNELTAAYDTCLEIAIRGLFGPEMNRTRENFRILVLRQFAADQQRLPAGWLNLAIMKIQNAINIESERIYERAELQRIVSSTLPRLLDINNTPGN